MSILKVNLGRVRGMPGRSVPYIMRQRAGGEDVELLIQNAEDYIKRTDYNSGAANVLFDFRLAMPQESGASYFLFGQLWGVTSSSRPTPFFAARSGSSVKSYTAVVSQLVQTIDGEAYIYGHSFSFTDEAGNIVPYDAFGSVGTLVRIVVYR